MTVRYPLRSRGHPALQRHLIAPSCIFRFLERFAHPLCSQSQYWDWELPGMGQQGNKQLPVLSNPRTRASQRLSAVCQLLFLFFSYVGASGRGLFFSCPGMNQNAPTRRNPGWQRTYYITAPTPASRVRGAPGNGGIRVKGGAARRPRSCSR